MRNKNEKRRLTKSLKIMKAILRLLIFHRHCRFPAVIDDEFLRHRLYVISPKNSLDLKGWTLVGDITFSVFLIGSSFLSEHGLWYE